jgi:hypothetical protein
MPTPANSAQEVIVWILLFNRGDQPMRTGLPCTAPVNGLAVVLITVADPARDEADNAYPQRLPSVSDAVANVAVMRRALVADAKKTWV